MKRLIDEIRQRIAQWLLYRAAMVSPRTEEGRIVVISALNVIRELRSIKRPFKRAYPVNADTHHILRCCEISA